MKDQIGAVKGGAQRIVKLGYLPVEFNDPVAGYILVGRIEKHIFQFKRV
jgi:hypothetical protein